MLTPTDRAHLSELASVALVVIRRAFGRKVPWREAASIAKNALLDMEARRLKQVEHEAELAGDQDYVLLDMHKAVCDQLAHVVTELESTRRQRDRARRCLRVHAEDCGEEECREEVAAALGLDDEVPGSLSERVAASIPPEQLPKYVAAARAYDEATYGRYSSFHVDGFHDAGIKAAVESFAEETMDALRAATENIGILEDIRDRLRRRVHEAVDECQRRYAKTESNLAKLRALMRRAYELHGEEMKRRGESPQHHISGYGQATAAMFLRELEALKLVVAEAESWRDCLSGQVLADYELPLRNVVDVYRAWRKEEL